MSNFKKFLNVFFLRISCIYTIKYDLIGPHFSLPTALVSSPKRFPSLIHIPHPPFFPFFNNPLSLIFADSVYMTMGCPLGYKKPTSSRTQKKNDSLSPGTTHCQELLSNGVWRPSPICAGIWAGLNSHLVLVTTVALGS